MSTIRESIDKLQEYAGAYFETIYKAVFEYWTVPSIPSGGNILNGAFAVVLITLARAQMAQPTDASAVGSILVAAFFFILLVCGILIVFDRSVSNDAAARVANWHKLVSVVSVGITLGCAFIVFDKFVPWINPIFSVVNHFEWSGGAANRGVATVAAFCACGVILANTLYRTKLGTYLKTPRALAWTAIIFCIVIFGINLLVTKTEPFL